MSAARIAFVTHYTALYGANRSLLDLIRGLRGHGVESRVLCPGPGPVTEALKREGVETRILGFRRWRTRHRGRAPLRLAANVVVMPAILRQLRAWNVNLVYTNSSLVPVGAWAAFLLGLPHVWHLREFGREDYGLEHDIGAFVFRFWLRRAEAVVAVSEALGRRAHCDLRREVHVVYNGVVTKRRARELEEGDRRGRDGDRGGEAYVFAIVGTLGGRKGQGEAIDALARVRARGRAGRLWIVGSGLEGEEARLRERARRRGVAELVEFRGYVKDPFNVYAAADAVLVCSRSEAMGRVTAEAMFAGLPVIGYRGGATPELVIHEETGLLYEGGPEELADAMTRLVRDPERGREMGRRGRSRVDPELTVEAYAERVHQIIARALDGGRFRDGG